MLNKLYTIDILLTSEKKPILIEINGVHSGIFDTLANIYTTDEGRKYEKECSRVFSQILQSGIEVSKAELVGCNTSPEVYFCQWLSRNVSYSSVPVIFFPSFPKELSKSIGIVFGIKQHYKEVSHLDPSIIVNTKEIEETTVNKGLVCALMHLIGWGDYIPRTVVVHNQSNRNTVKRFIDEHTSEIIIKKPLTGSHQRGISLFHREEFPISEQMSERGYVLQDYVVSDITEEDNHNYLSQARVFYFNGVQYIYWKRSNKEYAEGSLDFNSLVLGASTGNVIFYREKEDTEIVTNFVETIIPKLEDAIVFYELKDLFNEADINDDVVPAISYGRRINEFYEVLDIL